MPQGHQCGLGESWRSIIRFVILCQHCSNAPALALIVGLADGLLPAFRAARMNIVEALRAA